MSTICPVHVAQDCHEGCPYREGNISPAAVSAQQSIPSVALARMVWTLADLRQWNCGCGMWDVQSREWAQMFPASASFEYYRIIDRLSRGEAP